MSSSIYAVLCLSKDSFLRRSMKWVESPVHGQGGPDWVEVKSTSTFAVDSETGLTMAFRTIYKQLSPSQAHTL